MHLQMNENYKGNKNVEANIILNYFQCYLRIKFLGFYILTMMEIINLTVTAWGNRAQKNQIWKHWTV